LAHPLVKENVLLPIYFKSKAVDDASLDAIENLEAFLKGK